MDTSNSIFCLNISRSIEFNWFIKFLNQIPLFVQIRYFWFSPNSCPFLIFQLNSNWRMQDLFILIHCNVKWTCNCTIGFVTDWCWNGIEAVRKAQLRASSFLFIFSPKALPFCIVWGHKQKVFQLFDNKTLRPMPSSSVIYASENRLYKLWWFWLKNNKCRNTFRFPKLSI